MSNVFLSVKTGQDSHTSGFKMSFIFICTPTLAIIAKYYQYVPVDTVPDDESSRGEGFCETLAFRLH